LRVINSMGILHPPLFLYILVLGGVNKISEVEKMSKKYTYEEVKEIINNLEFELLSNEYINNKQELIIRDNEGYFYISNLNRLVSNRFPNKFYETNPYTIQNIKLWLKNNNPKFELLSKNFKNQKEKLIFKDIDGFLYAVIIGSLEQSSNLNKFDISNPHTIQNIKLWCKLNNKTFKLISDKYIESKKILEWKCLKEGCREIFKASWNNIYNGKGCGFCEGMQVGLSNCLATKNPKLSKEWHPIKNGDLTPFDVTENSNKNIWWKCDKGHEWNISVSSRNSNCSDCPYCSGRYASKENNLLLNNSTLCEEWHYGKNKKNPEEYTPHSGLKVWWKCRECSSEWEAKIASRNNGSGCPECNESKGEKRCKEVFNYKNIYYIPQKEFDGLLGLGNGNLSYDFCLSQYNLLIEYQGVQHEKYIKGFHKSIKDFEKQLEHDRRKREYAFKNGYNFLEIWYWDFDNIESILEEYLLNINK